MGAIYKILFLGDKNAGEVYPFLSEETIKKHSEAMMRDFMVALRESTYNIDSHSFATKF